MTSSCAHTAATASLSAASPSNASSFAPGPLSTGNSADRESRAPVLTSLAEDDLYKATMWQAMLHKHPSSWARYAFVCRSQPEFALSELVDEVNAELDRLCTLRYTQSELDYLRSLRFIKSDFVDFLSIFQFQRQFIRAWAEGPDLHIEACGPQVHVMDFEIHVLSLVNELYFRRLQTPQTLDEGRRRLATKIQTVKTYCDQDKSAFPFELIDFGLRRRFSGAWHREVVQTLHNELPGVFKGTSNVLFAKEMGLTAIGTMAHEYLQTYQSHGVRLRDFQKAAFEDWVQEYRGDLGIALTDVVGMDAFLADFDLYFAKLFDGLRHDSGCPYTWGEKALSHYAKLRIDPRTKRLVFSDGLDVPAGIALHQHFGNRIQTSICIGTNLSNDTGIKPLNIVMKLVEANGQSVAKLSDSPGKTLCKDQAFLAYLRQVFNVKQ